MYHYLFINNINGFWQKVQQVAEEIRRKGGKAWWYICDVTSEKDIKDKAEQIARDVGDITMLINNAGIMQNVPLLELDSEKIKRTFDVNTLAHFWVSVIIISRYCISLYIVIYIMILWGKIDLNRK